MPDASAPAPRPQDSTPPPAEQGNRITLNRLILIGVAIVALVLLGLFVVAVGPRWWAQRVGAMVDGRLFMGSVIGIVFGLVFTAAPIVFFGVAGRHLRSVGKAIAALVAGLVLALPNLGTLMIVLGNGSAAHAGERILDVDGPGFRGGSLVGAIIGAVLGAWIVYLMWSRRRRGRELAQLKAEEKKHSADLPAGDAGGAADTGAR